MTGADVDHVSHRLVAVPGHRASGNACAEPMLGDVVGDFAVVRCRGRVEGLRKAIRALRRIEVEEEAITRCVEEPMCRSRAVVDPPQCLLDIGGHRAFHLSRRPRARRLLEDPHPVGEPFEIGEQHGAAGNSQPIGQWRDRRGGAGVGRHGAQVVGQFLRRGVAILDASTHHLQADSLQCGRDRCVDLPRWRRLCRGDRFSQFGIRCAFERPPARQQFVEHNAQAEDVGMGVDPVLLAANLLRRHVLGRAGQSLPADQRRREIRDEHISHRVQQQIAGMNVPVHEFIHVRRVNRVSDGDHEPRALLA